MVPRTRQPIELIQAKGKKRLTKEEIAERQASELKVDLKNINIPGYLTKKQKEEFQEIASKLLYIGIMTELDEDCLARYIISKHTYLSLTKKLNKKEIKNDIDQLDRIMTLQDKSFKQCRACANDLGLTITSRCKLILPKTPENPKENKFAKFVI